LIIIAFIFPLLLLLGFLLHQTTSFLLSLYSPLSTPYLLDHPMIPLSGLGCAISLLTTSFLTIVESAAPRPVLFMLVGRIALLLSFELCQRLDAYFNAMVFHCLYIVCVMKVQMRLSRLVAQFIRARGSGAATLFAQWLEEEHGIRVPRLEKREE
jgi:hypothetical protein